MVAKIIGAFLLFVVPVYAILAAILGGVSIVPDTPKELVILAVVWGLSLPAVLKQSSPSNEVTRVAEQQYRLDNDDWR